MRKDIEEFCDNLDAAIFTGDGLHDLKSLEEFDEYIQRWTREYYNIKSLVVSEILEEQNKGKI
jgi:hypothetical protein